MQQFAHGKEELRPPRFSAKNKPEIFKSYISSGSSSSSHGTKSCSVKQIITSSTAAAISWPTPPTPMASSTSTLENKPVPVSIDNRKVPNPARSCSNWSPRDDGIEVLPLGLSDRKKNPTKEDLEAQIQKILYGTGSAKRLPAFLNICTE